MSAGSDFICSSIKVKLVENFVMIENFVIEVEVSLNFLVSSGNECFEGLQEMFVCVVVLHSFTILCKIMKPVSFGKS